MLASSPSAARLPWSRARWALPLLALALAAPSVAARFYCDDALFVGRLEGALPSPRPGPFSIYAFTGAPDVPSPFWWTSEALRMAFFRPLASALFALDQALFGRASAPYHVHSILWFVAAVILAGALHRRVLPARSGALATLIFTLAPMHVMVAYWPSARHVAVAAVLGFGALLLHVRAREQGRRPIAALALMAVALLASEIALGALAYVLTYEALGHEAGPRPPRAVARGVAPYAVLAAAYLVAYRLLGYGVRDSGDYADPLQTPLAFLRNVPRHLGPLACSTFFGIPSESSVAFPRLVPAMIAIGAAATLAFALLARRAFRLASDEERRAIRWLLPGALLACTPGLGGIVGDRALFVPSLGLSATLAVTLLNGARAESSPKAPWAPRIGVALLGVFQLATAPIAFLAQGASFVGASRAAMDVVARAELPADAATEVFGIGIADPLIGMYLEPTRLMSGAPRQEVQLLTVSLHDHEIRRDDDRTLTIRILGGTLLESGFETVVRPATAPLLAGDEVKAPHAAIRVVEAIDGSPSCFTVTFDRSLSDSTLALLVWREGALRRLSLAVGESVTLVHEKGPVGF